MRFHEVWSPRHVNTEEDTASQQSSSLKEDTASGYHHCRLQAAKVWKTTHCHFITAYIIFHAHNTFEYKPQTYRKQFCIVCCLHYFNLVSQRTYFCKFPFCLYAMRGCANTSTFHSNTMHFCFHKEVLHWQICLYAIRDCTNTINFQNQHFDQLVW